MSGVWSQDFLPRHNARKLALWLALSLALHIALMAWTPRLQFRSGSPPTAPLTVTLRELPPPPEIAAPPPEPMAEPPPVRKAQPAAPKPRREDAKPREVPPREPIIARAKPEVSAPPLPTPAPSPPQTAEAPPTPATPQLSTPPPAEPDLAAFVEARRRARGEGVDPAVAEAERANRGAVNNATLNQSVAASLRPPQTRNGYGSFEIRRRGYDYAEYMFKGWNENFRRDGLELIEVRKGDAASIDLAVVRSMIQIIRRTERGDFPWYSRRLGRTLTLSARAQDNATLEAFIMQEFYDDLHRYR